MTDHWKKKSKGNAKVYTHPEAREGRAVVVNHYGVFFNGETFASLNEAKEAACSTSSDSRMTDD